jgi:hypothetical protein
MTSRGHHWHRALRAAPSASLTLLAVLSVGCLEAPPPDSSYERVEVSAEVFRVFCRRVAKDAYPEEASGDRFYPICDGKAEDGGELDPEDEPKPQLRALLRRRPEIIDSLERTFGETDVDGGETFADGELSGFLKALVPLYDKPNETVPTATRGIAQLLEQLIDPQDARAQKVLQTIERLSNRTGYRAPSRNLGAIRALLTYPQLDELAQKLLPVVSAGGIAHEQWVSVLNAAALELADEPVVVSDLDSTTLHRAVELLLAEDEAHASNNVPSALVLKRDKANGNALASVGGALPTPFAIAGRDDDAERDADGIASEGGEPAYQTFDASKTLLAALMRETSLLIDRGDADRSPLENFAHGLKPLLGPRTSRTEKIGQNQYAFEGPDIDQSALLDLTHALASMARYPEAAPLIKALEVLLRTNESDATAVVHVALAIDALADDYENAKLNGPHEFWDDLLAAGERMSKRPGLIEALIRSFTDPRSAAQGKLFASWMRYKDEISYPNSPSDDFADINKPVEGKYRELVDRDLPDIGMNRSVWQRTMSLINGLNGVQVCNKEGAILNVTTQGLGVLTFPALNPAGYKRCELIEMQDAVEVYSQAMIGKSKVAIKDTFAEILSVLGSALGISGNVAQIQETESQIKGFTDKPTPQALARFIFAPRSKFVTDLFVPQETVDKLPIAEYEPNALFPMELRDERTDVQGKASSFLELGVPLIEAFDGKELRNPLDNKLLDGYMFGHLLSVFHRHWSSRKDDPCPASVEPGNEGCTQSIDPAAPLYAPQTGLVSYEELLAESFAEQDLVGVLHRATIALAAIKVPGPTGQIDGITALGNFVQRALTPDPTLKKRDGVTTRTKTNLCVEEGGGCRGGIGRVIPQLSPMSLLADALKAMDDTFAQPDNEGRLEAWHAGRSGLIDQLLTVGRSGTAGNYKYELRDRTAYHLALSALPWLHQLLEEHRAAGDLTAWADGLSGRATTILRHPLTAATVDLLDAFWPEAEASGEFTKVSAYLTNEENEDAYLGMLVALADSMTLIDRDPNLSPAIQFAALGLAPNAFQAIEGSTPPNGDKSVAYAALELTGGVVKELNKGKAPGTQTALSKLLRNLVLGDERERSPLEVLLDATADVNRTDDTALPETPLTADENREVFSDVRGFLFDQDQEKRSLERLYTVIQGRKIKQ